MTKGTHITAPPRSTDRVRDRFPELSDGDLILLAERRPIWWAVKDGCAATAVHGARACPGWTATSPTTSSIIEGINSIVQAAEAEAHGYRETLKATTHPIAGTLDLKRRT